MWSLSNPKCRHWTWSCVQDNLACKSCSKDQDQSKSEASLLLSTVRAFYIELSNNLFVDFRSCTSVTYKKENYSIHICILCVKPSIFVHNLNMALILFNYDNIINISFQHCHGVTGKLILYASSRFSIALVWNIWVCFKQK